MRAFVQKPKAASHNAPAVRRARTAAGDRAAWRAPANDAVRTQGREPAFPLHDLNTITVHPPAGRIAIPRPGDASEQEAHRASEQVMRMPQPQPDLPRGNPVQDLSPPSLHPVGEQGAASMTDPPPLANVLAAGGHPLDADTRAFMEPRFHKNFSHVRLHWDARAGASARAVQARAFTIGHHIVLAPGEYAPGTPAGQALLAHELAHVVQQSSIDVHAPRLLQREPSGPTYGNLPRDAPAFGSSRNVVKLQNVNGTWREVGGKYGRTARGNYDFVIKDGESTRSKPRTP